MVVADPRFAASLDRQLGALHPRVRHNAKRRMREDLTGPQRLAPRAAPVEGRVVVVAGRAFRPPVDPTSPVLTIHVGAQTLTRFGQTVTPGPVAFRYLTALAMNEGGSLTVRELADALWGDDPAGGPLSVRDCLSQLDTRVRPALPPLGLSILAPYGGRELLIHDAPPQPIGC